MVYGFGFFATHSDRRARSRFVLSATLTWILGAFPILEYDHFTDRGFFGCAVTGGYRYRGTAVPRLEGLYVFGDLCTGKIFGGAEVGGAWQARLLLDAALFLSTFGEDEEGELYLGAGGVGPGAVYRIVNP